VRYFEPLIAGSRNNFEQPSSLNIPNVVNSVAGGERGIIKSGGKSADYRKTQQKAADLTGLF